MNKQTQHDDGYIINIEGKDGTKCVCGDYNLPWAICSAIRSVSLPRG